VSGRQNQTMTLISAPLELALDLGVSIGVGVIILHSLRDCR
jgi:hypothetical protein